MQSDGWTLALQVVNFAILAWLLHRFLYKPVLRMVDARRAEIDRQQKVAAELVAKAKADREAIAGERAGIAAERAATLKAAAAEAEAAGAARRAKAEQESAALLDAARKSLADERAAAVREARLLALDLGSDIARRLLAEIPLEFRCEAWLEKIERHLAGLADAERSAMLDAVGGEGLRVVTAVALPEKSAAAWRRRLEQAIGRDVVIDFAADPALLAGVELHFPTAILRLSWRDEIASLRSEIENHGIAR